ncbi:MAG TPA: ABC transporter permease, partial [Pyrinomonadaceae bacterium]|nr:ABC transporter permease [Pyrinomonadaceae bacterium]
MKRQEKSQTHSLKGAALRGRPFSRRIVLPERIRSFPVFRFAAIWEAFLVATASLRANKLRTALTLVGIVVGVAAVIAVVTIIKGLDKTVATTFSSQGSTVFTVSKNPQIVKSREEFVKFNKRKD